MKIRPLNGRLFLAFIIFIGTSAALSYAQTNTFPDSGNVGIGTTSPTMPLYVATDGTGGALAFQASNAGPNADPGINMRHSRGEVAAPTATISGDRLGQILAQGYDGTSWLTAGAIHVFAEGTPGITIPGSLRFLTSSSTATDIERMRLDSNGNVGIGTTNPTSKLHVAGDAKITGNLTTDGNIAAKYQDVAEWVRSPSSLAPGTVVVIDPVENNRVLPSSQSYDTRVAGVVSSQPGIILGEAGADKAKVAHSGRVKVKVDAQYGPVEVGDLLVSSATSGYAMVSKPIDFNGVSLHRPGTIVGKALEPLKEGQGEILVLLTLQ